MDSDPDLPLQHGLCAAVLPKGSRVIPRDQVFNVRATVMETRQSIFTHQFSATFQGGFIP
jgi:hypothetical protein